MSEIELPEFSAELTLVVACSRWPFNKSVEREIQTRAAAPIDWSRFLDWVRRNRIAPLVYYNLRQTGSPLIPETVVARIQSEAAKNARRVLIQVAEAARITRLLADAGIRSMIIKGPVLSLLAFGDLTLRESQDIDVVIDPARLLDVDRLMVQAGYRRITPEVELALFQYKIYQRWRCQFRYYLDSLDLFLEVHWRLTSNSLLMPSDATKLFSCSKEVSVGGASFRTLADEELFLYLCVHGSVHIWFRLKWLADIAALLQRLRPEIIERIARRAQSLGLNRPFHAALILAHGLMAAPVPSDVLAKTCGDQATRKLVVAGCKALNWRGSPGEPSETPWFNTWLSWHAFRLKPGFRYRVRELQDQLFSPEDWARVRLLEQLYFLYLPLRPLSWTIRKIQDLLRGWSRST